MGETVAELRIEPYHLHHADDGLLLLLGAAHVMDTHTLGDRALDVHAGVQGGEGVLGYHLHLLAHGPQGGFGHVLQVVTLEENIAGGDLITLEQAVAHCGLAGTGLAHDAQRLSPLNGEGDAVHRLDRAHLALEQAGGDREVHFQVLDHHDVLQLVLGLALEGSLLVLHIHVVSRAAHTLSTSSRSAWAASRWKQAHQCCSPTCSGWGRSVRQRSSAYLQRLWNAQQLGGILDISGGSPSMV